jgi:hypothetical protein
MVTYGTKVTAHRIELNGIVQEEEIGLLMRVPLHLADERLLPTGDEYQDDATNDKLFHGLPSLVAMGEPLLSRS